MSKQIHVEKQMIEGTAKFVNVCRNEQQVNHDYRDQNSCWNYDRRSIERMNGK